MASTDEQLVKTIRAEWESDDPNTRLRAIERIQVAARDGVRLPQTSVIPILRAAMYEDYRPYPREVWIEALVVAETVCNSYGWDFKLFSPLVED